MSSLNDKLTLANNNVSKTYMAGKSGKDITNWSYYFYFNTRLDMIDYINTCNGTNFTNMFRACSNLTTIPALDMSNGTNFSSMFYSCSNLTTIPALDTSNGIIFTNMFRDCSNLTTINFTGAINDIDISFKVCSKLTLETLQAIVNALKVTTKTTKPVLTLNSASWAILDAATPPDGYASWKEYITNYKNWLYA